MSLAIIQGKNYSQHKYATEFTNKGPKCMLKKILHQFLPTILIDIARTINQTIYSTRLRRQIDIKNQRVINASVISHQPINLELGSVKKRDGWITVDLDKNSDICLDLSRPIPFPDNCVTKIYSSHLLEHFFYPKSMTDLLSECYRILKPGGSFSVAVPNARIYLEAYTSLEEFDYRKYCSYDVGLFFKTKIDFVNYMAYMGGVHRHLFDEKNLIIILSDAGFKNVKLRNFDSALDLEGRCFQSIYAEGTK